MAQDFFVAMCLVLVIEGLLPALVPGRWRALVLSLVSVDERTIRLVGLSSMLIGAGLLYLVE
jgi:hypothetical protein